jgi:transposase
MDLADGYRRFGWNYFPNANIVADKFHVIRLLSPHIFKALREVTKKRVKKPAKKHLLIPSWELEHFERKALWAKLQQFPQLNELYWWKEHLHRFYRIKGVHRAATALDVTIYQMKQSCLEEIQKLANTLESWKEEIVNYFEFRVTNATTEGYNNVAKLVQKRAFGYKSHRNYRLRVLNACA